MPASPHRESPQPGSPLLDQLGGLEVLTRIMDDFVHRIQSDQMIGFFFSGVDLARLTRLETQFAARALGAQVPYEGRGLRQAHATHAIADGQFNRRRELLRQTLRDHGAPEAVSQALLAHTEQLRAAVTVAPGHGCNHPSGGTLGVEVGADGSESPLDWPQRDWP